MASISKRKSGWQAQIRKRGYAPVSKRFDKRADAEVWARQIESEFDRGVFVDRTEAQNTTLGEVLLRYKAEVTVTKRGFVQENSRIDCFLRRPLANRYLATLRSADFAAYRDERLREVCGTTVNKELNLLARVIDTARMDWSIHVENPVKLVRRPKNNPGRSRRLQAGEEERLIAATESPALAFVIVIALETAMRRGEIANARWEHLNLRGRILRVPVTKTDCPRDVPLTTRAVATFEAIPQNSGGLVMGMKPQSITLAFERACKRACILDLRFHDLRHEAASRLFERGLNVMQVAAITGHKTLQMLKRYTHLRAEDLVKLIG